MIISNPTRNYLYFNRKNNQILYNLYDLINIDLIRTASLKAHEKNISHFFSRPDQYQEVFSGISLIPPRSRWNYDGNNFRCLNVNIVSSNYKSQISELLNISERLSSVIDNKKIAIELSGGLDTAIVIGIVKHLGFDPFLVGMRSSRYELRTESFIQAKYAESFKNVCLLNADDSLPFSNLKSSPLHQHPSSSSLYYMHALRIAEECERENVNTILSGMGFDALLCESVNKTETNAMPNNWYTWMLDDNWFRENIYSKYNMNYTSGAASQLIIKSIWALRKTQNEDLKKWWARNAFKEYLPTELVNYSYKADNSGGFLDGFLNSRNEISEIYNVAYEITKFKEFEKSELKALYANAHIVDENKDKLILSRVSFANWIFGLVRENIIS
jgi:hypothetical protein